MGFPRGVIRLFIGFAVLSYGLGGVAQEPLPSLDDTAALEAWLDGVMKGQLEAYHSAGAVVSIVKDGEVLFEKGYGYKDVDAYEPVEPETTLFRIGSVSKLFVWISVMQLVEQGKLNLNADVNTYLDDVRVPDKYDAPITMKHLMTHTPGFEDQVIGLFSHDPNSIQPLATVLEREMPARVRPPGTEPSYSNHGTGLAMHVVEEITGQRWNDYISENILQPLGMDHTVLAQPVPEQYEDDLSQGYRFVNQVFKEQEFEFVPLGPVGGISASAGDMAKFMKMFLHYGEESTAGVLEDNTIDEMMSEAFRAAPQVNRMGYGLIDMSVPGVEIIGHGGDTLWFHTALALFPEHGVGLFASYNTDTGTQARTALVDAFAERYFAPEQPEKLEPPNNFESRASRYAGAYRANRYSHKTFAKLAVALGPEFVTYDGEGALKFTHSGDTRWIEVEPDVFQEEHGDQRIVFLDNAEGRITGFMLSEMPIIAFDRVGAFGSPVVHAVVFAVTVIVCLIAVIGWPFAAMTRFHYESVRMRESLIPIPARLLGWLAAATTLVFIGGLVFETSDPMEVVFGVPPALETFLALPLAVAVLTLVMLALAVRFWMNGRGSWFSRLMYSILALVLCAFLWQAVYWNLTLVQNLQVL